MYHSRLHDHQQLAHHYGTDSFQPPPPRAAYAACAFVALAYLATNFATLALVMRTFDAPNGVRYARMLLLTNEGPGYIVMGIERPRRVFVWGHGRRGWEDLNGQLTDGATHEWKRFGVRHSSDDDQAPNDTPRTMTIVNWAYVLVPAGLLAWWAWRRRSFDRRLNHVSPSGRTSPSGDS